MPAVSPGKQMQEDAFCGWKQVWCGCHKVDCRTPAEAPETSIALQQLPHAAAVMPLNEVAARDESKVCCSLQECVDCLHVQVSYCWPAGLEWWRE